MIDIYAKLCFRRATTQFSINTNRSTRFYTLIFSILRTAILIAGKLKHDEVFTTK